jgi:Rieske Fe-S protein
MERRSFLKFLTRCLGAAFAATLGVPALMYFLDPRNRGARASAFKPVAKLSDLKVNVPFEAIIRESRRDAWTLHPSDVVGRVWLLRRDEKTVDAFTTICPHLGCSINFESNQQLFICPCHNGTFDLNGAVLNRPGATNPAPRGMDSLEVQLVPDPASHADKPDFVVQVHYQSFLQNIAQKTVRS